VRGFSPSVSFCRDHAAQAALIPQLDEMAQRLAAWHCRPDLDLLTRGLQDLGEALWKSPYYLERLKAFGTAPSDLRSVDSLTAFPLLYREDLARNWQDLPALQAGTGLDSASVVRSSGSTGSPVFVPKDRLDTLAMWGVLRHFMRARGLLPERVKNVVLLCGLSSEIEYEEALPAFFEARLFRVSTRKEGAQERLEAINPEVVFTDPMGLHWLMGHGPRISPWLTLSSAQHLPPEMRRQAEDWLDCPVVDYYATTETGPLAENCPEVDGRFHALGPDVWLEETDEGLAVTRLRPSALPLLRWFTGDVAKVTFGECVCGRRGQMLEGLSGRRACTFVNVERQEIDAWSLAPLFKHHALSEFRLTQHEPSRFVLEVNGSTATESQRLLQNLQITLKAHGFGNIAIELVQTAIKAPPGGKAEPFALADGLMARMTASMPWMMD
jgi:phenylacetate-CoA ligase